jgi:hypothetical protein
MLEFTLLNHTKLGALKKTFHMILGAHGVTPEFFPFSVIFSQCIMSMICSIVQNILKSLSEFCIQQSSLWIAHIFGSVFRVFWAVLFAGPFYYKGYYHLFYQYNPNGAIWGDITWGHAVSKNLVHWLYLEDALKPDQWYDSLGVWSGSTTIGPDGIPFILYTG